MKNSADRGGGCYPQRPKAEVDNTLRENSHPQKIDTRKASWYFFVTTKVSTLISVEGGKALSRSLNDKVSNI